MSLKKVIIVKGQPNSGKSSVLRTLIRLLINTSSCNCLGCWKCDNNGNLKQNDSKLESGDYGASIEIQLKGGVVENVFAYTTGDLPRRIDIAFKEAINRGASTLVMAVSAKNGCEEHFLKRVLNLASKNVYPKYMVYCTTKEPVFPERPTNNSVRIKEYCDDIILRKIWEELHV